MNPVASASFRAPTAEDREKVRNRPFGRSPAMYQKWRDLLFLHWEADPAVIQEKLPHGVWVDTFENRAYLGVVPFYMDDIRPRFLPPIPGISWFLEMNVRTYVHDEQGRPGVWFFSLDANQALAVATARTFFHLPYTQARMTAEKTPDGWIDYQCHRNGTPENEKCHFRYRGVEPFHSAEPGSLEFFLAERYLLFSHHPGKGKLFCGQVHHPPYPLAPADVASFSATPIEQAGFPLPDGPPVSALYSPGVSVNVFSLTPSERNSQ